MGNVMTIGIFLLVAILGSIWGAKKRIGAGWSFFFIFFLAVIPGLIFVAISPSLNDLKPYNKKEKWSDITIAVTSILMILSSLNKLLFTPSYITEAEGREGSNMYLIAVVIAFSGLTYYVINRKKRNNAMYETAHFHENSDIS